MMLCWALRCLSPRAGSGDQLSYHGIARRGSQPITFIPPVGPPPETPDPPEKYLNLTFDNLQVPSKFTSYMCKARGSFSWWERFKVSHSPALQTEDRLGSVKGSRIC